jgi:hypothetical protein
MNFNIFGIIIAKITLSTAIQINKPDTPEDEMYLGGIADIPYDTLNLTGK